MEVQQFTAGHAHFVGIGVNELVMHHEETGIKSARPIRRRDSARDKVHLVEGRLHTVVKITLPDAVTGSESRRGLTADDSSGTPGIKEAMEFVQSLPFGAVLLAAMGAGVIMFATYSFAEAFWREINIEEGV